MGTTPITPDPTGQRDILRDLLVLIEDIRYARQEQWLVLPHPSGRKFTQFELTQLALPTYGNLLAGRSGRLPARQQLLDLAAYLECTIAETNDLLRCAQYLPQYEPLSEAHYARAVTRATGFMQLFSLPAVVMGRGGEGIIANEPFLRMSNFAPFEEWQPQQRNIIHSSFDPSLPAHTLLTTTPELWQSTASGTIELLKSTSGQFIHEPWFKKQLEAWHQLPDFSAYWNGTDHTSTPFDDAVQTRMQTPFLQDPICEAATVIPFSSATEVCLIVWQPVDEAARYVYETLGCDLAGSQWGAMLADVEQ